MLYRALRFRLTSPGLVGDTLGAPVRAFTLGVQTLAGLVPHRRVPERRRRAARARRRSRPRAGDSLVHRRESRSRIVRQLLTESLLIAVAGGVGGVGLAVAGARLISAWRAPAAFQLPSTSRSMRAVLVFAAVISTVAAVVFGLAPARQAAQTDPNAVLKGTPRHAAQAPPMGVSGSASSACRSCSAVSWSRLVCSRSSDCGAPSRCRSVSTLAG